MFTGVFFIAAHCRFMDVIVVIWIRVFDAEHHYLNVFLGYLANMQMTQFQRSETNTCRHQSVSCVRMLRLTATAWRGGVSLQ